MKKMMIFAVMMSMMLMPAQMMAKNDKNAKPKVENRVDNKKEKKDDKFDNKKDDKKNDKFDNKKDDKKNDKFDNKKDDKKFKDDKKNDFNKKPNKPEPPIVKQPKPRPNPQPQVQVKVVKEVNPLASVISLAALVALIAN